MATYTEDAIQQEIDDVSACVAEMSYDDENSWIDQLELNSTNNQSHLHVTNLSLDVSGTVLKELDDNTKDTWLFPLGYEKRDYQYNISRSTLFHNTLVILPTGLGKTFISSVTIYNFMRWFPHSKIVFMAPTRPLVMQQLHACYEVVGISSSQTAEMTGKLAKKKRKELWDTKKVFFATPQLIQSDLKEGLFPCKAIKLLVFDEAHRAMGNYAYCKVVEEIYRVNRNFRVLGLTATAGKSSDIIQIIQNLLISKIEYRSENSIDVQRYTHKKHIEIIPVKLSGDLQEIFDHFTKVIDPLIKELRDTGQIKTSQVSKGYLIMQKKKLASDFSIPNHLKSEPMLNFSTAIGFFHSLEILQRHSVHLFLKSLREDDDKSNFKFFIARNYALRQYVEQLEAKYAPVSPFQVNVNPLPNGNIPPLPADKVIDYGHPKFEILKSKLTTYFEKEGTKAIVFCEYRNTAQLIFTLLLQLRPLIKPSTLIGQGGVMSQKVQLQIMKNFRDGTLNTLICTSIGEEGLDIGEVDLVVCFDINTKSSIRFVQRIGRTARKRDGRVIVLASEGQELSMSKDLTFSRNKMNNSVTKNKEIVNYLYRGVKLFPDGFNPKCIEMKFVFQDENEANSDNKKSKTKTKKTTKKKQNEPTTSNVITNFLKPIERKSKESIPEPEQAEELIMPEIGNQEVLPCVEPMPCDVPAQINFSCEEIFKSYENHIKEFLDNECIKHNSYAHDIVEHFVEGEVKLGLDLFEFLNKPVEDDCKMELIKDVDFKYIKNAPPFLVGPPAVNRREALRAKKPALMPSKVPEMFKSPEKSHLSTTPIQKSTLNLNSPLMPINFSELKNSSTPIRKVFSPRNNSMLLSKSRTNICEKEKSLERNFSQKILTDNVADPQSPPKTNKFEFLGIMSVDDIFEGCDSRMDYNTSIFTEQIHKSSVREDVVESSAALEEPATSQVLKNLNIRDIDDIFESSEEKLPLAENNIGPSEDIDCASDHTEIYDVDEEIAKIEESRISNSVIEPSFEVAKDNFENKEVEVIESSQKENIQDDSCLQKADSKPNLSRLMSIMQSSSIFPSNNVMQEQSTNMLKFDYNSQDVETQIIDVKCATPNSKEFTINSSESTPDVTFSPMTSLKRFHSSPFTPKQMGRGSKPTKRRLLRKRKNKPHNDFLQTQAHVDDTASSDEIDDFDDSLVDFVDNKTILDHTMMGNIYLKSLQSPNAPVNNRLVLRQLQPVNMSAIYSQMPHPDEEVDDESDDLDSFICDEDQVPTVESEVDELEIAERMLREKKRKRKRLNEIGSEKSKKRKIVVARPDSSDEDEELKRLRRELMDNPD